MNFDFDFIILPRIFQKILVQRAREILLQYCTFWTLIEKYYVDEFINRIRKQDYV